jgi:hypothetical protein
VIGQLSRWKMIEQFNELLKKDGLELWEFGASQTVMPVPDFTAGTYLTSSVMFVSRKLPDDKAKVLGVEIPSTDSTDLLAPSFLQKVKENFEKIGVTISIGDRMPTSALWMKL